MDNQEINIGSLNAAQLAQLTVALVNDARVRYQLGTEAEKQTLNKLFAALTTAFKPTGHAILQVTYQASLTYEDRGETKTFGQAELRKLGVPEENIEHRTLQQIDLSTLRDGDVLNVAVPFAKTVRLKHVVDNSKVDLPDNWAQDLAGALATAFEKLPTPTVQNDVVVNVPEDEDGPSEIVFNRDHRGAQAGHAR